MATFNKTPLGTIGAYRFSNGIAFGIHGEGNCCSLEYNPNKNELQLLIRDCAIEHQKIKIVHCDEDWKEVSV